MSTVGQRCRVRVQSNGDSDDCGELCFPGFSALLRYWLGQGIIPQLTYERAWLDADEKLGGAG